ncbi:galactose mutarotase [Nesterenkonia sp.]|uniref:aldose epimerase family protein n=1 Tax=Nesterenkonia sp. TaxID=704201 RepID=UPI00262AD6F4|nr:galactose mutarotase [Nesterenkonia sp.]
MSTTTPSVTITADGYTAEIALRGGQLLSLTSADPASGKAQNLVVPAERGEGAYPGMVLAPWPNRIAGASYTYEGTEYSLTANEQETGAALHGLLFSTLLQVQHQKDNEVHLAGVLPPSEGYPFRLEVSLVYRVAGHLGLTATLSTRFAPAAEDGAEPGTSAPFGVGFHPYLTADDAPLKACRLRLPASTVAQTQANGRVTGRQPVSGDLDLTDGPLLAGLRIDHAYTDLPQEGWSAELQHGPSGLVVRMISDTPWAQVYTGDRISRAGVAVEPMTCPPDAFNSGEDLMTLTAGGDDDGAATPSPWVRVGYSIEAIRR